MSELSRLSELSGTVTGLLKPRQPLALWWQRHYPGLREVSRELATRLQAARTADTADTADTTDTTDTTDSAEAAEVADTPNKLAAHSSHSSQVTRVTHDSHGIPITSNMLSTLSVPSVPSVPIPVDTPGLRYYDYGLLGGAIDYRMRMEFTREWGGDPARSAFTRAWGGKRGSLAHAAAALLADCAPALALGHAHAHAHAGSHSVRAVPGARGGNLAVSLPALVDLLEERAANLDELAPWDWGGPYATSQHEEPWVLDYCIVLAELDNFYRSWATRFDFTPLLSPSGYRSALYASGQTGAGRNASWEHGHDHMSGSRSVDDTSSIRQRDAAVQIVRELERAWPLFAYLCWTPLPTLEEMASVVCRPGRLPLLRQDLAAQLALWHRNPARRGKRPPRVIAANPTFAGSKRLPADGDLIVRSQEGTGSLIDFKSAKRIEPAGMLVVLRQILTYALMDERDEYEIRRVGFYFTRYGVWAHWGLGELLDRGMSLGKGQSKSVDSHQQGLLRFLLDLRQPQAIDVATRSRGRGAR